MWLTHSKLLSTCLVVFFVRVFLVFLGFVLRSAAIGVLYRHQVVQAEFREVSAQPQPCSRAAYQCTNGRTIFTTLASSSLKSGASTCLSVNLPIGRRSIQVHGEHATRCTHL